MGRRGIKNIDNKILQEVMLQSYKNGIASVSTKEVARKLHISEPVIFAHFKTKANLMAKTFAAAWNEFPHIFCFPHDLSNIADDMAFTQYKEKVTIACAHPVALIYISDFLRSQYYSYNLVVELEGTYRKDIISLFKTLNPKLTDGELSLVAENFIETSITTLVHIVKGHYPRSDETLLFYYVIRIYGFVAILDMKGALAPESYRKRFLGE